MYFSSVHEMVIMLPSRSKLNTARVTTSGVKGGMNTPHFLAAKIKSLELDLLETWGQRATQNIGQKRDCFSPWNSPRRNKCCKNFRRSKSFFWFTGRFRSLNKTKRKRHCFNIPRCMGFGWCQLDCHTLCTWLLWLYVAGCLSSPSGSFCNSRAFCDFHLSFGCLNTIENGSAEVRMRSSFDSSIA